MKPGAVHPGDTVARYDGEEFACLLPETDAPGALLLAQRLVQAVADLTRPHAASSTAPMLTVSVGVGSFLPAMDGDTQGLLDSADTALYRAKREGRARACGQSERGGV